MFRNRNFREIYFQRFDRRFLIFFSVNRSIPVEITSMPDAVLNTPFGKLIEAQLSNFQINPN